MSHPASLISRKTGNWWADDRRFWCAYCGCKLSTEAPPNGRPTRDHVIPRIHRGRHVTIPACRQCNSRRGNKGLPEFMLTEYFSDVRSKNPGTAWPLRDLWLVVALAAVEQARSSETST